MLVHYRTFWAPKAGRTAEEYEDAFWPREGSSTLGSNNLRFAIADGATESSFARLWARMLTLSYCAQQIAVPSTVDAWRTLVDSKCVAWTQRVFSVSLPWNVLAKAQQGAFASLLGLTLEPPNTQPPHCGKWFATAIGDSCLFQVRNEQLVSAFPIDNPEQLGYHPLLLSSVASKNDQVWDSFSTCVTQGDWQAGDRFWLMTDALALWLLTMEKSEGGALTVLSAASSSREGFAIWLDRLRRQQGIRNDDVTLTQVEIMDIP